MDEKPLLKSHFLLLLPAVSAYASAYVAAATTTAAATAADVAAATAAVAAAATDVPTPRTTLQLPLPLTSYIIRILNNILSFYSLKYSLSMGRLSPKVLLLPATSPFMQT